jgi:hypothetical protein
LPALIVSPKAHSEVQCDSFSRIFLVQKEAMKVPGRRGFFLLSARAADELGAFCAQQKGRQLFICELLAECIHGSSIKAMCLPVWDAAEKLFLPKKNWSASQFVAVRCRRTRICMQRRQIHFHHWSQHPIV